MAMVNRKFYALQKKLLNTFGITIGLGFKKAALIGGLFYMVSH